MAKKKASPDNAGQGAGTYPYHTLDSALNLGEAVKAHGGRDVPKALIARDLSLSAGALYQLVASARCYGVVEGSRDMSLTENAHNYFFPTTENAVQQSLLLFFSAPATFRSLIDRFDGNRVPSQAILANIAQRDLGVPKSWAARAVATFVGTANSLELIDAGGFLRYGAALHQAARLTTTVAPSDVQSTHGSPAPTTSTTTTTTAAPHAAYFQKATTLTPGVPSSASIVHASSTGRWTYSEAGGTVHVETPDPLPRALWERLKKYVDMLEPSQPLGGQMVVGKSADGS